MTKQELEDDLEVAIIELKKRCTDASKNCGRVCVYQDLGWYDDGVQCRFAKNGTCKAWELIEKYKGQENE